MNDSDHPHILQFNRAGSIKFVSLAQNTSCTRPHVRAFSSWREGERGETGEEKDEEEEEEKGGCRAELLSERSHC